MTRARPSSVGLAERAALERLNALPTDRAERDLGRVCGSRAWMRSVVARRPFGDREALFAAAEAAWDALGPDDWKEAFATHPRIGERVPAGRPGAWPRREQAGMESVTEESRAALADLQRRYEARFGYVFLICATGKGADEMLATCRTRLGNDPETEIRVAADEERKIGRLRLEKLLAEGG